MAVLSDIAKMHIDAAIAKAAATGCPPHSIARIMLSSANNRMRDIGDMQALAEELNCVIDSLAPDGEYTFMRR